MTPNLKDPPLWWAIIHCFLSPKQWLERVIIGQAFCYLWPKAFDDEEISQAAETLKKISDKLWDEFNAKYHS